LKETNKLRYQHIADAVTLDDVMSSKLQDALNKMADINNVEKCWSKCVGEAAGVTARCETAAAGGPDPNPCKDNGYTGDDKNTIAITVYKEADTTKLKDFRTTGRATT
jgi:hypothetical protein